MNEESKTKTFFVLKKLEQLLRDNFPLEEYRISVTKTSFTSGNRNAIIVTTTKDLAQLEFKLSVTAYRNRSALRKLEINEYGGKLSKIYTQLFSQDTHKTLISFSMSMFSFALFEANFKELVSTCETCRALNVDLKDSGFIIQEGINIEL